MNFHMIDDCGGGKTCMLVDFDVLQGNLLVLAYVNHENVSVC